MQFRRLKRPNNEAIRTTVRSFESYRDRCLEVQTSSVNGTAMTLTVFIDGKQCLKKSVTSSNEALMLARGLKIGMALIDAMEADREPATTHTPTPSFRHDGELATEIHASL